MKILRNILKFLQKNIRGADITRRFNKLKIKGIEYDRSEEEILNSILSQYDYNTNMFDSFDIFLENLKPCLVLSISERIKWKNFLNAAEHSVNPINILDLRNILVLLVKKERLVKKLIKKYEYTLAKRGSYYSN